MMLSLTSKRHLKNLPIEEHREFSSKI